MYWCFKPRLWSSIASRCNWSGSNQWCYIAAILRSSDTVRGRSLSWPFSFWACTQFLLLTLALFQTRKCSLYQARSFCLKSWPDCSRRGRLENFRQKSQQSMTRSNLGKSSLRCRHLFCSHNCPCKMLNLTPRFFRLRSHQRSNHNSRLLEYFNMRFTRAWKRFVGFEEDFCQMFRQLFNS